MVCSIEDLIAEPDQDIAICSFTYTGGGGVSRVIENQSIKLTDAGHEVTIVTLDSDYDPPDGVSVKEFGHGFESFLARIYRVCFPLTLRFFRSVHYLSDFDVVICHRYPFTVSSFIASRLSDTTYIFWTHPSGDPSDDLPALANIWVQLLHYLEINNVTIRKADWICAVSEPSKDYAEKYVDQDVKVVRNEPNVERFGSSNPAEVYEKYEISEDDIVVLYVGRITPKKNVHTLIDIFESADAANRVTLLLVGKQTVTQYADRLKERTGEDVVFTGYVEDELLGNIYQCSDIFITCSLEEGWGLPISEANEFDVPIIAFESHPAAKNVESAHLVPRKDYERFRTELSELIKQLS